MKTWAFRQSVLATLLSVAFSFGSVLIADDAAASEALDQAMLYQALVILEDDDGGSGSGFIANIRDRTFLVTNVHVLAMSDKLKATTISGENVPISGRAFLSKKRDIAIVPIQWEGPALETAENLLSGAYPNGSEVVVYGNEGGGGVVTNLEGEIKGIGPISVEVTAEFIPGNSGSPVIHKETGIVIGVASYLREMTGALDVEDDSDDEQSNDSDDGESGDDESEEEDSDDKKSKKDEDGKSMFSNMRRFAYRIDGNMEWEAMDIRTLAREAEKFYEYEDATYILAEIVYNLTRRKVVMTGYRSHPKIGNVIARLDKDYNWNRGFSSPTNIRLIEEFRNDLLTEINRDEYTASTLKCSYYSSQAEDLLKFRKYIYNELNKHDF